MPSHGTGKFFISDEELRLYFNQNFNIFSKATIQQNSKLASITISQSANVVSARSVDVSSVRNRDDSCSSVGSNDSNEEELLEKCIQAGMTASSKSKPKKVDTKKEDSSSDDEPNVVDGALLEQCIQAGMTGISVVGSKSQVFFTIT